MQSIAAISAELWILAGLALCLVMGITLVALKHRQGGKRAAQYASKAGGSSTRRTAGVSRPESRRRTSSAMAGDDTSSGGNAGQSSGSVRPKVAPIGRPTVPFAIRAAEVHGAGAKGGRAFRHIRLEVSGSVQVEETTDISLLVTVEDLTSGSVQKVFATVDDLQDERTGLFVGRAGLGKVGPGGLVKKGWDEVLTIPADCLQSSCSGLRRLRFSCICVPTGNVAASVIEPTLRSRICATAVTELEIELPTKGYLEADKEREEAAGMILCVAWGFVHALGGSQREARTVISAWSAQAPSLLGGASGMPSAGLGLVLENADKLGQSGRMGFLPACEALARSPVAEASLMGFELCCRLAKASSAAVETSYAMLRDGALAMGVGHEEFSRLMRSHLSSPGDLSEEELVGMDPSWPREQIARFLREQFGKWNARSGGVTASSEKRDIAIRLNALAKLRLKYL